MIYPALLLYFVLEYVRPSSYWPQLLALHLNSIIPLTTLFGNLVTSAAETKSRVLNDTNTRVVGTLVLLVWLSVLTADVQLLAWNIFMMVVGFSCIYWLISCELTSIGKIKGAFMTLIGVHVIVAGLNPVLFTDPNNRHYIASGAFLGDGNDFALSVTITIPLCLFLMFDSKMFFKIGWASCLLLLLAGVVLTQSRGGTLGLIGMGVYYWLKNPRKMRMAAIIAVLVALVLAFAPPAYFERMNMIADTEEGSASARIAAWKTAVRMALWNPILGVGAGHFPTKIGNEFRTDAIVGAGMNAHSIYFQVLGELGLPGIGVLLYFIISNLLANRRLVRELNAQGAAVNHRYIQLLASCSAALIAYATAGAFLSAAYYPHMFVLAGVLSSTRHVVRQLTLNTVTISTEPAKPRITYHPALRPRPRQHQLPGTAASGR